MVGSNGLAWGRGIHTEIRDGRQKLEGDSCAPAGIFPVGAAFGYSRLPGFPLKIAYRWITDRDYFVDDPESHDYNEWITIDVHEPNTPAAKWKSFEIMKRSDALYELGLIVGQNINPTVKSRGSAIFFHEWAGPGSPTTGCTSMALPDLVELLAWLDPGQSPIIIQAPSPAIGKLTFGTTG
jgi:L,D-peptidoglycan transpeptidase YkuD (ErfK/YbiS/YcfS/YnhG family)